MPSVLIGVWSMELLVQILQNRASVKSGVPGGYLTFQKTGLGEAFKIDLGHCSLTCIYFYFCTVVLRGMCTKLGGPPNLF